MRRRNRQSFGIRKIKSVATNIARHGRIVERRYEVASVFSERTYFKRRIEQEAIIV